MEIVSKYTVSLPFDPKASVLKALEYVPSSDLHALDQVVLIDSLKNDNGEPIGSQYWPASEGNCASVEIALESIFEVFPRSWLRIPVLVDLLIYSQIYDNVEIHNRYLVNNNDDRNTGRLTNLSGYSDRLLQKAFWRWVPLLLLIRFFVRQWKRLAARLDGTN